MRKLGARRYRLRRDPAEPSAIIVTRGSHRVARGFMNDRESLSWVAEPGHAVPLEHREALSILIVHGLTGTFTPER